MATNPARTASTALPEKIAKPSRYTATPSKNNQP